MYDLYYWFSYTGFLDKIYIVSDRHDIKTSQILSLNTVTVLQSLLLG